YAPVAQSGQSGCLLSSGSEVRVLPGAQPQVKGHIRPNCLTALHSIAHTHPLTGWGEIMPRTATKTDIGSVPRLAASFEISLAARNLSPRTVRTYLEAVDLLAGYLEDAGMPTQVAAITREHLEAFFARELKRVSPTSVHIRFRALQQFFRFL